MEGLGQFDVVYSWGVVHHTGDLWGAVRNVASRVTTDGVLYLAVYNKLHDWQVADSKGVEYWTAAKKRYYQSSELRRKFMDARYLLREYVLSGLLSRSNPLIVPGLARNVQRLVRKSRSRRGRGMDFLTNVRDWLGGYPYEPAATAEVVEKVESMGFSTLRVNEWGGLSNTEYLFRRHNA